MITDSGQQLILDTGTGARPLGTDIMQTAPRPFRAAILLSHTHWDHIQGFPFFAPLFIPGNEFTICAPEGVGVSLAHVLAGQMEFTYFPVQLDQLPGKISYRDLPEGQHEINGVRVRTQYLNHPAICLGYRIEADGVSICYLTDHEPFSDTLWRADAPPGQIESILHAGDRRHAEFMRGADLIIHDAQYTPDEYPAKKNWGHSTYEYILELAAATGVKNVALIHHDPLHDDQAVQLIENAAVAFAQRYPLGPDVFCAYEGCDLQIKPAAGPTASSPIPAIFTTKLTRRQNILLADDDFNIHLLAEAALSKDYEVTTAEDGEECLASIRSTIPDLLILDLNMPNLDGFAVLRHLRAEMALHHLPILVLTASGDETSTRSAFEAGATDYLTKPFTIPQLTTRVATCFARSANSASPPD